MENSIITQTEKYYKTCIIFFVALSFLIMVMSRVNINMFTYQIVMIFIGAFFFLNGLKRKKINEVYILIIVFQALALFVMTNLAPFEMPPDSGSYINYSITLSKRDNWLYYLQRYTEISDQGVFLFTTPIYIIFGENIGYYMVGVEKMICHLITCIFLYKTSTRFFDKKISQAITLLFGLNIFAAYWIGACLKENYFTMLVVAAAYYMVRLTEKTTLLNFFLFIFFVYCTRYFRGSYPAYFAIGYLSYLGLRRFPTFFTRWFLVILIIFSIVGTSVVLQYMPELSGSIEEKEETYGSGALQTLAIINAFIAPYPTIANTPQNANLISMPYAIVNLSFSFFAFMGIYYVTRKRITKLYPLAFVFVLNAVMLIITGFTLNARFAYPVIPIYYIFIPIGLMYAYKKRWYTIYLVGAAAITILYNIR